MGSAKLESSGCADYPSVYHLVRGPLKLRVKMKKQLVNCI